VRSVQPAGPYLLGGYCNGALVAFEMAQLLRAQGQKIDLLVLLAPMPMNRGFETRALPDRLEERLDWQNRAMYDRRRIALEICDHVCRRYVPRSYPGPLTMLQPMHSLHGGEESSRGWKEFAPRVEVQLIPGSHVTCVTAHANAVGKRLRDCLLQADAAAGFPAVSCDEPAGPPP
jgi:thioesterase domain-containing protein